MRFTRYTKYKGSWMDALNLEQLLENLSDFLLNGGFAGGPHYHPYWGWSGTEDTDSVDALKEAILRALIESGQLTQEMLEELSGEGSGDKEIQEKIAELLDRPGPAHGGRGIHHPGEREAPDARADAGHHRAG
jgi:Ca-activated chloride channel family protein